MPTAVGRKLRGKAKPGGELEPSRVNVKPPWQGYAPDVNPEMAQFTAFESSQGFVDQDGILTIDSGWYRLEDALGVTLPLGGVDQFTGAGNLAQTATDEAFAQPIVLLAELRRNDGGTPGDLLFAATGLSLVTLPIIPGPPPVDGTATIGFAWYLNAALNWVNVPFNVAVGSPIAAERDEMFDWAPFPTGGTVIVASVGPGEIYFTNKVDEVYVWDPGAAVGPPGEYSSAFGVTLGAAAFFAKSVELYDDRLVFLNTGESGEERTKRCRWTTIATTPALTGAGSGFIDMNELQGDGLRVLKFEDLAAAYFEDGVVLLRRTGNRTNPFNIQYLTKERGLMGTFAVTRLSSDLHFGIFSDGWFFLNSQGQWTEAGLVTIGDIKVQKWSRTFYNILDTSRKNETVVSHDQYTDRIRIAFPLTDGTNTVWVYDRKADTVWPADPYEVTIWGDAVSTVQEAIAWSDFPIGDLWSTTGGDWADYGAILGERVVLHGTEDGLVLLHSQAHVARDGDQPTWIFRTHKQSGLNARTLKTTDTLAIDHQVRGESSSVSAFFTSQSTTVVSENFDLQTENGSAGFRDTSVVHGTLTDMSIGFGVSGVGEVKFYSFQPEFRTETTDKKSS